MCGAAKRRFMSCEKIVETQDLLKEGPVQTLLINRMMIDGVIEAPGGAHFTECPPDYGRDEAFQREYAVSARDPEAWAAFKKKFLELDSEDEYQKAVEAR
jgi:glutaconate CoA-transferase subunit A